MKKVLFIQIIAMILNANLLGQIDINIVYEKALLIKKNSDTIKCQVEVIPVYQGETAPLTEGYVNYKIEENKKIQNLKIKEIKTILTSEKTYQNILVNKTEYLFKEIVLGKFSLFEYPKISITSTINSGGQIYYKFGPRAIKYYAIKTNENTYILTKLKDLNPILTDIDQCPEAKALYNDKSFKFEELKSLIIKLNNCNQK